MKLPWAEQSDKDKTTSSPLPTPQFAADNTTDNKSVGNGTALVCTFLPGPLTEAALTFLIKNFRPDAPECDNGSSALGNLFSHRSKRSGNPIKV